MIAATDRTIEDFLPQIEEALAYTDTHDPVDMVQAILDGNAQLWTRGDGLVVTEIEDTPKARILRFWVAAGDMGDCLDLAEEAEEWGRSIGCERATVLGRKGWKRVLPERGWEPNEKLVCFTKDLTEKRIG